MVKKTECLLFRNYSDRGRWDLKVSSDCNKCFLRGNGAGEVHQGQTMKVLVTISRNLNFIVAMMWCQGRVLTKEAK